MSKFFKVTTGYVKQQFDIIKKKFINQWCHADGEVEYIKEDENGDITHLSDEVVNLMEQDYLPFIMTQPSILENDKDIEFDILKNVNISKLKDITLLELYRTLFEELDNKIGVLDYYTYTEMCDLYSLYNNIGKQLYERKLIPELKLVSYENIIQMA